MISSNNKKCIMLFCTALFVCNAFGMENNDAKGTFEQSETVQKEDEKRWYKKNLFGKGWSETPYQCAIEILTFLENGKIVIHFLFLNKDWNRLVKKYLQGSLCQHNSKIKIEYERMSIDGLPIGNELPADIVFKKLDRLNRYIKNLTELIICDLSLKDKYFKNFINLKKLTICDCKDVKLDSLIPENLKYLSIAVLNLENQSFANLNNLKKLKISDCKNAPMNSIFNLKNLTKLRCFNQDLDNQSFENLKKLRKLIIKLCKHINAIYIFTLTNLEELEIWNIGLKDKSFEHFTKLKRLDINDSCQNVDLERIKKELPEGCKISYW